MVHLRRGLNTSTLAIFRGVTRLFLNGFIYTGGTAHRPTILCKTPGSRFAHSFQRNIAGFGCEVTVSSYQTSCLHLPHNSDKASEKAWSKAKQMLCSRLILKLPETAMWPIPEWQVQTAAFWKERLNSRAGIRLSGHSHYKTLSCL